MKVLVTGSSGYLGARLVELLRKESGLQIFGTYLSAGQNAELERPNEFLVDISQREQVDRVLEGIQPDIVVHTAGIAHGDLSNDEGMLKLVNVEGTRNIVESSRKYNSKILYVSTIGVLSSGSAYGKSKLEGEKIVQDSFLDYCIIRPSIIIGVSPNRDPGIMFNSLLEAVLRGNEVVIDSEWKFQVSWIDAVCEVIIQWILGKFQDQGPIYPIVPEVKSRYEIAQDILSHFGLTAKPIQNPRYPDNQLIGQESLIRNNLPTYNYQNILTTILQQITQLKGN